MSLTIHHTKKPQIKLLARVVMSEISILVTSTNNEDLHPTTKKEKL